MTRKFVPAPELGDGYQRDAATGEVFYSAAWLGPEPAPLELALNVAEVRVAEQIEAMPLELPPYFRTAGRPLIVDDDGSPA